MTDSITNLAKQLEPFFLFKAREGMVKVTNLDEAFVTIGNTPNLSKERALTAGVLMDLTDGGSNGLVTLDVQLYNIARITTLGDTFEYAASAAGLASALAASVSRDVLLLPPVTIAGSVSVPSGVTLVGWGRRKDIVLSGQVTGGNDSILRNVTVQRSANDASALIGVLGPSTGIFRLYECLVEVTQAGAGDAYAVREADGGTLYCWGCELSGSSTGGNGYAASLTSGIIELYHGKAFGTKDRFLVQ